MATTFKVWITKYVFTAGIFEEEVEDCEINKDMVAKHKSQFPVYYHKLDWHRTKAEAVTHALKMVAKKRKALKAALARLQKLESALMDEKVN